MTTQELKNKIEKVLGNSIRCMLPSYWWKNLFHSVADRIDEVETTVTENVSDMVVKSLKEFEAKHPDIERSTLYYTTDENSALARSNVTKILRWEFAVGSTTPEVLKPLHIAVPFITMGDEVSAYIIQSPMYALDIFTESILFADVPFEGKSNIYINIYTGVATLKPASSSDGGSVMFVTNPIGDLTEEQKQNNADAYLKVIEAEGAIDINIMVMFFIAKPNMVSVDNNSNLVLLAAGTDGGASKYIITPEGDVTIETVESDTSEGVEIRELRINSNLSDEDKAYNIETVELYKEGKALVITPITYSQTSTDRTDRMAAPFFVDLHTGDSTKLATFRFLAPQIDETDPFGRGLIQEATVVISNDGSVSVTGGSFYDVAMSDTSTKAVQNKVIKKYIDDAIANVGQGGGGGTSGDITIDTEMSDSSVNAVQNKVVKKYVDDAIANAEIGGGDIDTSDFATKDDLNTKQDIINDLDTIRSGAAKGETAIQKVKTINGESIEGEGNIVIKGGETDTSNLATKEELNNLTNEVIANEEVHAAALNDLNERKADKDEIAAKQDTIADLDTIRNGAALGATALQSVPSEYSPTLDVLKAVYPVGAIYISTVATSPQILFGFGTWERIQDRFLLSAGSSYDAGSTGGEATHKLTQSEIPAHTHTRGTMEIYGALTERPCSSSAEILNSKADGAFKSTMQGDDLQWGVTVQTSGSSTHKNNLHEFIASRNWTGETSSVGGGAAHNNMPPYLAVYMWKRTA